MNYTNHVCLNGHLTVKTDKLFCDICNARIVPLKLVTKRLRLELDIIGYDEKNPRLAIVRYKYDNSIDYLVKEDILEIESYDMYKVLETIFDYRIITSK